MHRDALGRRFDFCRHHKIRRFVPILDFNKILCRAGSSALKSD